MPHRLFLFALILAATGCVDAGPSGSTDDDDTVDPIVADCFRLTFDITEAHTDASVTAPPTGVYDDLLGTQATFSACGITDEFRGQGLSRYTWAQPDLTLDGLPDDLADDMLAGWSDGWILLSINAGDDGPLFQAAQIGGGNHIVTINASHQDPLDLGLDDDGNPLRDNFETACAPALGFVPDLDDATALSDAVTGPATIAMF